MSDIYFIATKHPEYAEMEFGSDSVVLDPFRYIPDQPGVRVRRIGEAKPEMISLLVPSRDRPHRFATMLESAFSTATHAKHVEVICRVDADDPTKSSYPNVNWWASRGRLQYVVGPRDTLSKLWNECYERARGTILMHCGDDIVFRTPGWDALVRKAFSESEDKLILVHGDDSSPNTDALATHGFLHRRWVETVGYFVPPLFSSDWNDVWLTEVADMIGRRIKINIVTEHMHYGFGKAEYDKTYREREERGARDGVATLYEKTLKERKQDAAKLKAAMA